MQHDLVLSLNLCKVVSYLYCLTRKKSIPQTKLLLSLFSMTRNKNLNPLRLL
jgi:hypothetical protein